MIFLISLITNAPRVPHQSVVYGSRRIEAQSNDGRRLDSEVRRVIRNVLGTKAAEWEGRHLETIDIMETLGDGYYISYSSCDVTLDSLGRLRTLSVQPSTSAQDRNTSTQQQLPRLEDELASSVDRLLRATAPKGYHATNFQFRYEANGQVSVFFQIGIDSARDVTAHNRSWSYSATFDSRTGDPVDLQCSWQGFPRIDLSTCQTRLSRDYLDRQAEAVYRTMKPIAGVGIKSGLIYGVPAFPDGVTELTEEHIKMARENRSTLMYEWTVYPIEVTDQEFEGQLITVDARTGKALSWRPIYFPGTKDEIGKGHGHPQEGFNPAGSWRAVGTRPRGTITSVGNAKLGHPRTACVLIHQSGRMVTGEFDAKSNLIQIGKSVFRPSGQLVISLKSLPPIRKFGTTVGKAQ